MKYAFGIALILLIGTNLYWMFSTVDSAVTKTYQRDSCNKYLEDRDKLILIFKSQESLHKATELIKKSDILIDTFSKGELFIINFESFSLAYDKEGQLVEKETLVN